MERRHFVWRDEAEEHELDLVWVPGTNGTPYHFGYRARTRELEIPGFFVATTPVTQALWQRVLGFNPAINRHPRCPVENVSWDDVTKPGGFLDAINSGEILRAVASGGSGQRFRLPSEAEWEYAARGGPAWPEGHTFSGSDDPDTVAWYGPRWTRAHQALVTVLGWPTAWRLANRLRRMWPSRTSTHPVAMKAPNQLGLYDMSGNVWEWCQDTCSDDLEAVPCDGRPYDGQSVDRRLRGGCHHNWDLHCTVWWRYGIQRDAHDGCIGFRIVLAAP